MRRFTVAPDRITGNRVTFDRDESHHLTHVLRLRPGDTVVASDGSGRDYTVRLDRLGDSVTGAVLRVAERTAESPLAVTLLQGVAKGDRMERIVRAATELGVARVCPALTERTVVRHIRRPLHHKAGIRERLAHRCRERRFILHDQHS